MDLECVMEMAGSMLLFGGLNWISGDEMERTLRQNTSTVQLGASDVKSGTTLGIQKL